MSTPSQFRTDRNRNPTAFTTDLAAEAGLVLGKDYEQGDSFAAGARLLYTAKLLGDPLALTLKVIDEVGFYTQAGAHRWSYIAMPSWVWGKLLSYEVSPSSIYSSKIDVIGAMYRVEGGTEMRNLFPNYDKLSLF